MAYSNDTVLHVIAWFRAVQGGSDGVTVPVSGGLQRVLAASGWALICACNCGQPIPISVRRGVDSGYKTVLFARWAKGPIPPDCLYERVSR